MTGLQLQSCWRRAPSRGGGWCFKSSSRSPCKEGDPNSIWLREERLKGSAWPEAARDPFCWSFRVQGR